jgi:hypothetical protein
MRATRYVRIRIGTRGAWLAAALVLLAAAASLPATGPAYASYGISQRKGFDACGVGSTANADAFWLNTPYWNMGLYLGGSSYGTGCTRWSTAQVTTLRGQGWQFLPIWVGPQAPCTGFPSRFSSDPTTAYTEGSNEASAAYTTISNLGWDVASAPIIYDLEGFDTTNSTCVNAAKQFISGWVHVLHLAPAQTAGVYGSTCASDLAAFAGIADVPDFIDGAQWDGNTSTASLACISSSAWANRQRHKQYLGGHNETWNGVTLNVDSDCSNGPVYPSPDQLDNGQGCL